MDFHIFIIIFVFEKIGLKMKDEISVVKCPGGQMSGGKKVRRSPRTVVALYGRMAEYIGPIYIAMQYAMLMW